MVAKLIDPFDAPAKPATKKPVNNGGLVDPFDEAAAPMMASRGGTYETPTGRAPGTRQLMDTPEPLGVLDRMRSGVISDPQAKLEFFAARRFPGDPKAVERYGYLDGDPVYVGDDGAMYRENEGGTDWVSGNVASAVGGMAGPTVLGTIGGMVGGAPGAALGGAAGVAANKLAGLSMGDKQTAGRNAFDIGVEGVLQAAGWKLGEIGGKKILERRLVRDAAKFNRADTLKLQQAAKELGIDLTPAEASNLGSLISQQTQIGMGLDEAGDTIREFLTRRAGQVDDAVGKYIGTPPPIEVAGRAARNVGKSAITAAKAERKAAASPLYKSVVSNDNLLPANLMPDINGDPVLRRAFSDVKREGLFVDASVPDNSLAMVDAVKKHLDGIARTARRAGDDARAAAHEMRVKKLLDIADSAYPQYAQAREAFAGASPKITELAEGIEGALSRVKDMGLRNAADKVFSSTQISAPSVAKVRQQFMTQGKSAEYDDLLNAWLRQKWENLGDPRTGASLNQGAAFRQKVFGSKAKREIMREAMGPERFAGFEKLMDVLEATGRTSRGQSQTQPFMEGAKAMRAEASPILGREGGTPVLGDLKDWWVDRKLGQWKADLAKAITSPDSVADLEKLGKLRGLSPVSKDVLSLATTILTKAGVYGAASAFAGPQPDAAPRRAGPQPNQSGQPQ